MASSMKRSLSAWGLESCDLDFDTPMDAESLEIALLLYPNCLPWVASIQTSLMARPGADLGIPCGLFVGLRNDTEH